MEEKPVNEEHEAVEKNTVAQNEEVQSSTKDVVEKSDAAAEEVVEETETEEPEEVIEEQKEESKEPIATTSYEFNNEHNMIFEEFSMRLGVVGKLALFTSVIGFIHSGISLYNGYIINGTASLLLMGVLCLFIGVCHTRASKAFLNIVTTEGDDITFAMKAVNSLRLYYRALFGIAVAGIIATLAYTIVVILKHI